MSLTFVVAAQPSLSSPTLYLFDATGDTVVNTGGDTLTPGSNATGKYSATVAETLSGWHYYEVRTGSTVVRNGLVKLTDGATIYAGEMTSTEVTAVQSGLSTLAAADIRTAVGLASANLDTQLGDIPTNSELATAITTGLTTALTEGYRSTNATGSVRDLLYEILQNITEFSISSTTKTVKKLDGSTTAKTYTLNSATTPTSITEAT